MFWKDVIGDDVVDLNDNVTLTITTITTMAITITMTMTMRAINIVLTIINYELLILNIKYKIFCDFGVSSTLRYY